MSAKVIIILSVFVQVVYSQHFNHSKKYLLSKYDSIRPYKEGRAVVGNFIRKSKYRMFWNIIDEKGNAILPKDSTRDWATDFSEGLAWIENSSYRGFIDKFGRKVNKNDADKCSLGATFEGGLAKTLVSPEYGGQFCPLGDTEQNPHHYKVNYIDHDMHLLIPNAYDTIADFQHGQLRLVGKAGKFGLLDSLGKTKMLLSFDEVTPLYWKKWYLVRIEKIFAFIDIKTGQNVLSTWFEDVFPSAKSFTWVKKNGYWGAINQSGKYLIPCMYNGIIQFDTLGRAIAQKSLFYGMIDSTNTIVIPFHYQKLYPFQEGMALFQRENKFGFLNFRGKEIIAPQFKSATQFTNGKALVESTWYWEQINIDGSTSITSLKWFSYLIIVLILVIAIKMALFFSKT